MSRSLGVNQILITTVFNINVRFRSIYNYFGKLERWRQVISFKVEGSNSEEEMKWKDVSIGSNVGFRSVHTHCDKLLVTFSDAAGEL